MLHSGGCRVMGFSRFYPTVSHAIAQHAMAKCFKSWLVGCCHRGVAATRQQVDAHDNIWMQAKRPPADGVPLFGDRCKSSRRHATQGRRQTVFLNDYLLHFQLDGFWLRGSLHISAVCQLVGHFSAGSVYPNSRSGRPSLNELAMMSVLIW